MCRLSGIQYMGFVTCVTLQKKIPAHGSKQCCEGMVLRLRAGMGAGSGLPGVGSFFDRARRRGKRKGAFYGSSRDISWIICSIPLLVILAECGNTRVLGFAG